MTGAGMISVRFDVEGKRTPGLTLVEQLLADGSAEKVELTAEIAEQAIDALEGLELPGLFEEIIESGEQFAKQVHSVATQGLQEVVQNADDQGARNIRFGYRRRGARSELLIAHDGKPIEIVDVMRMALPLLSGSREDPDKIGRFGIGLKTLNQLGDRLAVHCPPVPGFEIRRGQVSRTKRSAAPIKGFWEPGRRETLFILRLERDEFDWAFFKAWLGTWDASSLLFLRTLRSVSLTNFSSGRRSQTLRCALEIGSERKVELSLPKAPTVRRVSIKEANGRGRWTRYTVDYPRPQRLLATNKASGETVRLQVAIPDREGKNRVYVGLPLEEPNELPYSFSAPFDPNVERTKLRDNNALNEWLIERIGDLAVAISLQRFSEQPRSGWGSVPLEGEAAGESSWVKQRFEKMASRHRRRVAEKVTLSPPDGTTVKLAELMFEHEEFEGLLEADQLDLLWERTWADDFGKRRAVPRRWRDGGRWRAFLTGLEGTEPLTAAECLMILDWPDSDLSGGAKWLVEVVAAGLRAGEEKELWARRCVALADDRGRLSPAEIEARGTLLVHLSPKRGDLAADLGLAEQIARAFKARQDAAGAVRKWLSERGVLRERAGDHDALRALARARLDSPIDLRRRDAVLVRLRNSFEKLTPDERAELGEGVGENLGLSGYRFERGKKVPVLARLSDAYLPSAIDKSIGWPTAAGQTPGLLWIDRRYSTLLRTRSRGGGALVFLRALGVATAPRLVAAAPPTSDPNAAPLASKRALSTQHRDELAPYPQATGLRDDWHSPDLKAVVADLIKEKRTTQRRKRAQALFLALDRAWGDVYEQRATATAVHHRYNWYSDGEVSATWVAELASAPWLSTQEPRFRAAPPRDLTVLTEASYEIEGDDLARYAYEIEGKQVDSPVVDALDIQGRPRASSILDQLETLRSAEAAGRDVHQAWADRCYTALASYVPGGAFGDRSDLTELQLKRAFAKGRGPTGLIRSGDRWLAPSGARRGPPLAASLGPVNPAADRLWDFLGIQSPTAADCAEVLATAVGEDGASVRSSEILAFRRLLDLQVEGKLKRNSLRKLPLRLHKSSKEGARSTVYAAPSATIAEALGQRWPTWNPPLPLAELAPLLPLLDVEVVDEGNFTAEIPGHLAGASFDVQDEFVAAAGHLHDYLALHHPTIHQRLTAAQWAELRRAHVIVGSGWGIRVKAKRRRSAILSVRAYLFREPLCLCLSHESEIDYPDTGGEAIAHFIVGDKEAPEERSTVALAWSYAYRIRDRTRDEISLAPLTSEAQDAPPAKSFEEFSRKRARPRGRRRSPAQPITPPPAPRELVDLEELRLDQMEATFLEGRRRTRLKVPAKTKIDSGERTNGNRPRAGAAGERSSPTAYTDRDREDAALAIVDAVLSAERGLDLEDARDQQGAGADAVDRKQDIWVELKAHGRDLPENLRFPSSEAARAEEKRGNYWLVVIWNLEKPRTPQFVVIPDPLYRLDTYLGRGLELTGLRDLAVKSAS
jgi:hypothetical protein